MRDSKEIADAIAKASLDPDQEQDDDINGNQRAPPFAGGMEEIV